MLAQVEIPGYGQALAGLDWLAVPGIDGKRKEIRQLGRSGQACWEYLWTAKGQGGDEDNVSVALLSKDDSRKRPVAAAALVRGAISEATFLVLIDVTAADETHSGDRRYWLLAVDHGMPVKQRDVVGDIHEVMAAFKDHLNTQAMGTVLKVYTDQADRLSSLTYKMEVRAFTLGILGHSVQKRDFNRAKFRRHTDLPVVPILLCIALVIAAGAYKIQQIQAENAALRDAAASRAKAIAQRKLELASAVSSALNSTIPVRVAVPAYLDATKDLKRSLAGWKLTEVECSGAGCKLTYKAQAFATWAGYLKAKPAEWPDPILESDIEKVTQLLPVTFPDYLPRAAESLTPRDQVRFRLGNLAQVSKNLGLTLSLPASWGRVAGNAALNSPEERWVPVAGDFVATGSAVLLKDWSRRLPDACDVSSLTFKLDDPLTFDMKGKAYANP
jgi:hypothetical protein